MPKYEKIGRNIGVRLFERYLIIRVNLDAPRKDSANGNTELIAQTNRFESLEEAIGEDMGLSLVLSQRKSAVKKAKAGNKPAKEEKVKRRAKRDDDDE